MRDRLPTGQLCTVHKHGYPVVGSGAPAPQTLFFPWFSVFFLCCFRQFLEAPVVPSFLHCFRSSSFFLARAFWAVSSCGTLHPHPPDFLLVGGLSHHYVNKLQCQNSRPNNCCFLPSILRIRPAPRCRETFGVWS